MKRCSASSRSRASRRHRAARRDEEVGVGALPAAADAAADLVELRQAEVVGAVHDDGVGGGDVEPALDDRGGEQHVELARDEAAHHLLELAPRPSARGRRRCGPAGTSSRRNFSIEWMERDPVVDEVDLPAAPELLLDGLLDLRRVELGDEGADGAPVLRRRGDDRHVAHAGQAHVERARDGRGGEREHVDELAQLLEPLLVGHPEALLLVDHHEPEVAEGDVGGEQPARYRVAPIEKPGLQCLHPV